MRWHWQVETKCSLAQLTQHSGLARGTELTDDWEAHLSEQVTAVSLA